MKHTPGPWQVYNAPLRPAFPTMVLEIQDAAGKEIVKWMGFDGVERPKRETLANARLMAAAPNLASACLTALTFLDELAIAGNEHAPAAVKKIKAALRRAGRSPL